MDGFKVSGLDRDGGVTQAKRAASRSRVVGASRRTESRVRELRLAAGMTQTELAAAMQTNVDTVRKAERGYLLRLRVDTVLRCANALNCGAADLFPVLSERLRL